MSALIDLTLREAAAGMASGAISRQEWSEAWLERMERLQPALNAFIRFDSESCRAALSTAAAGPLAGVPVAVKDNIVTADGPTTCASRMLEHFFSPFDATVVQRLKGAGAVTAGKTNMDEFAMGSSTEHSAFGPARNPWNLERVAGGSSGGSAAAVAARMTPVALGSDTGGSVRQPAALCGIIGLKPTWGRVSRSGLVAFASSLDQVGVCATSVEDCAAVLSVIAGHDAGDSTASEVPVPNYAGALGRGVKGLRFGVVREAVEQLREPVRSNFEESLHVLRSGGAEVREISIPSIGAAVAIYYIVANAEASANLARFDGIRYGRRAAASDLKETYRRSRGEGFGEEVKRRIMLGTFVLSSGYYEAYYGRAQALRAQLRREFDVAFGRCDFLLTPTTPDPAFRLGERAGDPLSMYLSDIFTTPANLTGVPAIALPSGFSAEGLPLSLQMMGPHFSEEQLLSAAAFFERETGHARRCPQV
jgi:aspartyl-tRNA(Asn)/glutamyl-tRNA(Gln) amidotransferase subunit A